MKFLAIWGFLTFVPCVLQMLCFMTIRMNHAIIHHDQNRVVQSILLLFGAREVYGVPFRTLEVRLPPIALAGIYEHMKKAYYLLSGYIGQTAK